MINAISSQTSLLLVTEEGAAGCSEEISRSDGIPLKETPSNRMQGLDRSLSIDFCHMVKFLIYVVI